jgi:uncharacterized protein (TIRG00374 family)
MSKQMIKSILLRKENILLFVILAVSLVTLPQLDSFTSSLDKLNNVNLHYAVLALVFSLGTYFMAAATYYFLAIKKIRYFQASIIQFAAMFINRILPAGIGAIGVSFGYLKKMKHSNVQAATVVSLNNLIGFVGNTLIIGLVVLITGFSIPKNSIFHANWIYLLIFLPGLLVLLYFMSNASRREKLAKAYKDVTKQIRIYKSNPSKLLYALGSSSFLSILNFLGLYACVYAVGGSVALTVVVIVYSFGIGLGSSVPTPGGLGAIEAGMVAGFVALGMPATTAFAAVILYRLISFWFVLLIGAGAFVYVQNKGLIKFKMN